MYFIIICIVVVQATITCDYHKQELDCVESRLTCRWNQGVCIYTEGLNFGCSISLSFGACIQQTYYPDDTLAQCIFSGYCRKVEGILQNCANNLSRSACLAVDNQYCIWNGSCQTITEEEAQNLNSDSVQNASVGVCRLRTDQAYVHQQGAHEELNIQYKSILLTNESQQYKQLMQKPGCINIPDLIYQKLNCNTAGLNKLGCQKIEQDKCIFDKVCNFVQDSFKLKCSDNLNRKACLSVMLERCSWINGNCMEIQSNFVCKYDQIVSPGVCAFEQKVECFYDTETYKCSQMCRSSETKKTETGCKQSSYGCKWQNDECIFDTSSQCGKIGQNKVSCMLTNENCRFINGQCLSVQSLDQLKCTSGLNQYSCLNLNNPSQVCKYEREQCQLIEITPQSICSQLENVNQNACRKVTTQTCYWQKDGKCYTSTTGQLECTTSGLNRIGCLSSTINSCQWNELSGICEEKKIFRSDSCEDQLLVNAVTCRKIKGSNCKYNSKSYNCEKFIMSDDIDCSTIGLNEDGCANISNITLSCRWVSNQCIEVESLGGAVTCSALQSVTYRTCAYVQQSKCQYDTNIKGCMTSVAVSSPCTQKGLNNYACASLISNCYFNDETKECLVATDYNNIKCDVNYPSKTTCLAITQQKQYCKWNQIDGICQLQTFPVSQPCTNYKNVNKLFCLAYEISITKRLSYDNNYCTYLDGNCISYQTLQNDCATSLDLNIHACVGLTSVNKYCYFNTDSLKCMEITDTHDPNLQNIQCKQCGKLLCASITTKDQLCMWNIDSINKGDDKCLTLDTIDRCNRYTSEYVNPNVCSSTSGDQACIHNNYQCQITIQTTLQCNTSGLNEYGCINNTNQSCYFEKSTKQCQEVKDDTASKVNCNDSVNQGGCLDSLKQPCFWDNVDKKCKDKQITSTITCSELNDQLYNAIVCASVNNGDKCSYNNGTRHCEIISTPTDCQSGYNEKACSTEICDFKQNICDDRAMPQQNDCMNKPYDDCLRVDRTACSWKNGQCNMIYDKSTCDIVIATGKQNKYACQIVQDDGCAYDDINKVCINITTTNNSCDVVGLNKFACIQQTIGHLCVFRDSCSESLNNMGCSDNLNADACASVKDYACTFDQQKKVCSQISDSDLTNFSCNTYTDQTKYKVNSLVCKYADDTSTCIYDQTNQVCKIDTTILNTCTIDQSINQKYCLNYIKETCQFIDYSCTQMTNYEYDCDQAVSFRQCVVSHNESCQWQNNKCLNISFQQDCITISNVNSIACMQNNYQSQQCQFKDNGMSTQCIIPINTTSQCEGLNKLACINNTTNSCYYFNYCIDIQQKPYLAECKVGYYFTQSACLLIQNPNQKCMLNNGDCTSITVSGTCNQYSQNIYSTQVCASITNEACYWNNGCIQGYATNCTTLGANSLACKGSINGNCIFTIRCLDVLIDDISNSKCTDPSNQNGCLNLYNGQTCQWNNNTCTQITVNNGCTSYQNVNPGVCSAVIDIPCIWNSNQCIQINSISNTCARGMNLLACVNYTSDICQFNNGMCKQVNDITQIECNANLNKNACLSHTTKCCKWDNNICINSTYTSTCNMMSTNYSKYCCSLQIGDKCTYTTSCQQLTIQNSRCSEAINQTACLWIYQPCQWDNNQCSPINNTVGCLDNINPAACIKQDTFCMYDVNNQKCITGNNDNCSLLQYASKNKDCTKVTDVGCQENMNSGCSLTTYSTECQSKVNQIGCLDNIKECEWDNDSCKMPQQSPDTKFIDCPNTTISRGQCSKYTNKCILDSNYKCVQYDKVINSKCKELNSISSVNNYLCAQIEGEKCQYQLNELRCTSIIKQQSCDDELTKVVTNQLGCKYIQQDCIWIENEGCEKLPFDTVFYECDKITSQYTCLHYKSTACKWDDINHKCIEYDGETLECTQHQGDQISPGICYYYSTNPCAHNGTKCIIDVGIGNCENSLSPLGCQNNTSICFWDMELALCQKLKVDEVEDMSCPDLRYSQQIYCTKPTTEGQTCHWINGLCENANAQEVNCTSELSKFGCLAVAKENESCIFKDNKCQDTDNTITQCSDNLNIYGCVNVQKEGEFCKWLGQQCSPLTDTDFNIDKHILINQHVCRRVNDLPAKYDSQNYICIQSIDDQCNTPGLNMKGCLLTNIAQCYWINDQCVEYDQTKQFQTCEEYITVSRKVCSSIIISGLSCYHDSKTYSCKTFDQLNFDYQNDVQTLNRQACLNIQLVGTQWDGQCQFSNIIKGVTQCNDLQNVNPISCALIDVDNVICKYDTDGKCTTVYDSSVDQCNTLGLNKLGCVLIQNNKCQFNNTQCEYYNGSIEICTNLINVNANVCQSLTTQSCKWNYLNRGCVNVYQDTCDAIGINQLGCNSLSNCTYIQNQCICNGLIQLYSIIDCTQYNKDNCYQTQCIYDEDYGCRNKICNDISIDQCDSTIINQYQCYRSQLYCKQAKQCSDLFYVSDCTKYKINNKQCNQDPYNTYHCVDQNCQHFTQNQCTGDCMWSYYLCEQKQCKYMKKTECIGIMNNEQCIYKEDQCVGITSCEDYMSYIDTELSQETQCNQQKILNKQCYWLQNQCISSLCRQFGLSSKNCYGSEVNSEVCVLVNNTCLSCNEITDPCICMNLTDYCYYNKSTGCQSNLCSGMNESQCQLDRCIYRENQCMQICSKLKETACKLRINDCHWNSNNNLCVDGIEPTYSINTMSDIIIVEVTYSIQISLFLIINFIIY